MAALQLTRDQLNKFCQGDQDMIRKFEQAFLGIEQIPTLEDGVDNNTLAISTLSDLVRPITINLVEPLSAQIAANTTYTLTAGEATEGMKTIFIPSAFLVASAGGPFTLTISTGLGTDSLVHISANGDTITSGDLMFDIHIDDSGNIATKSWEISGSNANGKYRKAHTGEMRQRGTTSVTTDTAFAPSFYKAVAVTVILPCPFNTIDTINATTNAGGASVGSTYISQQGGAPAPSVTQFAVGVWNSMNATAYGIYWTADGRWRA